MKLLSIVGARPNFVKCAAICQAIAAFNNRQVSEGFTKAAIYGSGTFQKIEHIIIHTGQHSSDAMSGCIWKELGLPEPITCNYEYDYTNPADRLGYMINAIATRIKFLDSTPHCILVYGDCDSTLAGALGANKLGLKVAHVEAGLRSGDRTMREEINRILVDQLADLLFVSEPSGMLNLAEENINHGVVVGNCMIDSLIRFRGEPVEPFDPPYAVLTLHRPSNVDSPVRLQEILEQVNRIEGVEQVVFPVHPRTKKAWTETHIGIWPYERILTRDPFGYRDFIALLEGASLVLTDSGGVQEESTFLGVPCLTLRDTTERPATLIENGGTNKLVGCDAGRIVEAAREAPRRPRGALKLPETWDGKAGQRIIQILAEKLP